MKLKNLAIALGLSAMSFTACQNMEAGNGGANEKTNISLKSEVDSVSYSLGISIGSNLKTQKIENLNVAILKNAIDEAFTKEEADLKIKPQEAGKKLETYFRKLHFEKMAKNKKAGEEFLAKNKKKAGVKTTESGLQYKIVRAGKGENPKASDKVRVHYKGTLVDGTVFDSSYERKKPAEFGVSGVIKGWGEALQLMKKGAKWELYIPSNLGYGQYPPRGGQIQPNSVLVFEVELLEILPKEEKKKEEKKK